MRPTVNKPTTKMGCRQRGKSPRMAPWTKRRETSSFSRVSAWVTLMATEALKSMMAMLTEYSPSWVRMPARIAGMPHWVFSNPVTRPASMPASRAASIAAQTLAPPENSMTNTAPPVQKEPSTVRSAMSRIL